MARRPHLVRSPEAAAAEPRKPGFFGKLPMRGDFVVRRFDGHLRGVVDGWLSASLTASRRLLGEEWAEAYRHAPAWRFLIAPGIAGPEPVAGVMVASTDNYGRQFPLVVAVEVFGCPAPLHLVREAEAWFAAAERAALWGLGAEADLDSFDNRVLALGQPVFNSDRAATALRFDFTDEAERARAYIGALQATLGDGGDEVTVWWTTGGGGVAASLLHHRGMPTPERFTALLDGRWEDWGWAQEIAPARISAAPPPPRGSAGQLRSAARSHRGTRRPNNQDAMLDRPDLGLWAVADGAGGHDAGAYASAVVIEKLAAFQVSMSFNSALTEIEDLLEDANEVLRAKGRQLGPERICAATVVALLINRGQYAAIWAGDSRAYLYREGRLQRLTRDHVSDGGRYVTRAVGADNTMLVDAARGEVQAGDRYILCSDGLVKCVGDRVLEAAVRRGNATEVASDLIDDALIAGAGDNVTALVVDVGD